MTKKMTLSNFIQAYDFDGSVVLLEGKRDVILADRHKLMALGELLAASTTKMLFRSGNASGSDELFSTGVAKINRNRLQVILPYEHHRAEAQLAGDVISLEQMNLTAEPEVVYQSKRNAKTQKLIDPYVQGDINRVTLKAAYIIRDTVKAIGSSRVPRATFGIFYDDLSNPKTGGTGHTMDVCIHNDIPIIDQRVWFEWL